VNFFAFGVLLQSVRNTEVWVLGFDRDVWFTHEVYHGGVICAIRRCHETPNGRHSIHIVIWGYRLWRRATLTVLQVVLILRFKTRPIRASSFRKSCYLPYRFLLGKPF